MSVEVAITSNGADKVIKELKKVESQASRLNSAVSGGGVGGMQGKGKDTRGYALLALSQGIEDFSVAGMRGMLNNIPQMLQFAGATPQMAAGISMIAVAAMVAGPKIFTLAKAFENLDAAQKKAQASLDRLGQLKDAIAIFDIGESQEKSMKSMSENMDRFTKSVEGPRKSLEDLISLQSKEKQAVDEVVAARLRLESIQTKGGMAASRQALIESRVMASELKTLKEQKALAEYKVSQLVHYPVPKNPRSKEGYMSDKDYRDEFIEKTSAKINYDNIIESAEADLAKRTKEQRGFMNMSERAVAELLGKDARAILPAQYKSLARDQDKIDALKEERRLNDLALKSLEQKKKIQDESVKNYDSSVNKINDEIRLTEQINKELGEKVKKSEELLRIKEDEARAQKVKELEETLKNATNQLMDTMPNGRDFLSSRGSVGLSGREASAALGVINAQKQANKYLAEIVRNTRSQIALYS